MCVWSWPAELASCSSSCPIIRVAGLVTTTATTDEEEELSSRNKGSTLQQQFAFFFINHDLWKRYGFGGGGAYIQFGVLPRFVADAADADAGVARMRLDDAASAADA